MRKLLAVAALLAVLAPCAGADDDLLWIRHRIAAAAGASCNVTNTATTSDTLNGSNDILWARTGGATWSFVSEARGSCSTGFWRTTNPSAGDRQDNNAGSPMAIAYLDMWFRVKVDGLADAAVIDIFRMQTADPFQCVYFRMTKTGTQLSVVPVPHTGGTFTAQNISADTWYHVRIKWDNTNNQASWAFGTTDTPSAIDTNVAASTTRSASIISIGRFAVSGTVGNTTLDYDSITMDGSAYKPVEYAL